MQRKTGEPARTVRRAPLLVFFMLAFSLCLAPSAAYAGPALEIEQGYVQPDGATFQAGQRGDEFFHYVRTTEGLLVQKSPADQTWYYVTSEGFGLALGPRADEAAPANALAPSVLANDTGKMAYSALGGGAYVPRDRGVGEAVTLSDIEAAQAASGAGARNARSVAQTETSLPLITIVIGFAGDEGTNLGPDDIVTGPDGSTWKASEQRYRDDYDWNRLLYSGENSITNYYATMSNDKFSWTPATEETSAYGEGGNTNAYDAPGDGVIHVTLDRNHGNWKGAEFMSPEAKDQHDAYVDALNEASQYIDFANYDANGNGVLEPTEVCLLFIVAGYESSGGEIDPSTWACRWQLSSMDKDSFAPATIVNPITHSEIVVDDYITMGEILTNDVVTAQPMPTSTVAHELGHYLGLPDLYDVNYTSYDPDATVDQFPWLAYDVGEISLMAGGSWGNYIADSGETVFVPVSFDPFCLEQLGYIEPVEVAADGTYDVSTLWSDEGYRCLRVPTSTEGEYYLVENRQYESFDRGLTSSYRAERHKDKPQYYNETGGVVIWHIDQGIVDARGTTADDPLLGNTVNTVDHRPGVMPVYPENTEYRDGQALYTRPFFNTSACETFGMEGNVVPLLQYNGCDTPDERVDSGIVLSVGDTVGDVMSVTVDLPEPDQPGGGYEESSHVGEIAGSRVEVSGSFPAGAELSLALSALTDEQKAEMAKASDQLGALIVSADASVVDAATSEKAAHEGKLSVSFSVDKRYEGESVWMVHRKADGSLETAKVAVENGLASMTVDELSPFAVFEQKAAGPADEDGNKPGGSPSDGNGAPSSGEPDGEEPSGDTQVEPLPGKALASTGDSAAAPAALALAIAAAVAAMIAQIKLRRRHDSQTQ